MTAVRIVLSTTDGVESAHRLAHRLVEENLVACVNIIPNLTSVYKWEGKVQREAEVLLLIKTSQERLEELISRIEELHEYDVPEVVVFPVEKGSAPYLEWVAEMTRQGS